MEANLKNIIRNLFFLPQWQIGVGYGDIDTILSTGSLPNITWWRNQPSAVFNADPFPLGEKIVYERMNRWRGKAEIWEANDDGTQPIRRLREAWHLSYPCISHIDNKCYAVIESSANHQCVVCEYDGNNWLELSAIPAPLVDATPFKYDGRYWIFSTQADGTENRALYIYWANSMLGPWRAHKGNPVKIDPSSSRPAGNVCASSKGWIRPAQDCSVTYGGALVLCRIEKLNENEYVETVVSRIQPVQPYNEGIHTINISNGKIIVDGKKLVFHPMALFFKKLSSYGMKYSPKGSNNTRRI